LFEDIRGEVGEEEEMKIREIIKKDWHWGIFSGCVAAVIYSCLGLNNGTWQLSTFIVTFPAGFIAFVIIKWLSH